MDTLGERIRLQRRKCGLSQEELSYQLNVTRQSISKWERDVVAPTFENICSLSEVLNVDVEYFMNIGVETSLEVIDDINNVEITPHIIETPVVVNSATMFDKKKSNLVIAWLLAAIVFTFILFIASCNATVVAYISAFPWNTGDTYVQTVPGGEELFLCVLFITIVLLVGLILLMLTLFRHIKKCKSENVNFS